MREKELRTAESKILLGTLEHSITHSERGAGLRGPRLMELMLGCARELGRLFRYVLILTEIVDGFVRMIEGISAQSSLQAVGNHECSHFNHR